MANNDDYRRQQEDERRRQAQAQDQRNRAAEDERRRWANEHDARQRRIASDSRRRQQGEADNREANRRRQQGEADNREANRRRKDEDDYQWDRWEEQQRAQQRQNQRADIQDGSTEGKQKEEGAFDRAQHGCCCGCGCVAFLAVFFSYLGILKAVDEAWFVLLSLVIIVGAVVGFASMSNSRR